jgi:hypothetical protein
MRFTRVLGVACLVAAVVLLMWSLDASDSLGSAFSRLFRGTPTDRTMRLLLGAGVAAVAGLGLLAWRPKRRS